MCRVINVIAGLFMVFSSLSIFAKPDVFFTDSSNYGDAYLSHVINKDANNIDHIKFILSSPITDIILPDEDFNLLSLRDFITDDYIFPNNQMRTEFIDMMEMSFESSFQGTVFLKELIKVLNAFKAQLVA